MTSSHAAITYTAGVIGSGNPLTPSSFYYGRETLELEYLSQGVYTVLDTKTIYQYPWNYNTSLGAQSPKAVFSNGVTGASEQVSSNPSPSASPSPAFPAFQGDPPRFTVNMYNLYPNGTTAVIIYPGTPLSATGAATVIPITSAATPPSPVPETRYASHPTPEPPRKRPTLHRRTDASATPAPKDR
ncbi:MAG: hypothetical protein JO279_16675 [Verrucomicrobia bacterium]|nr:hypothetical protein [Verrucomicrobiota bacterium]